MARGKTAHKRNKVNADERFGSLDISKFINKVMLDGKKSTAKELVYRGLELASQKLKKEPLDVFNEAIKNASPLLEVRSKRIGGAAYQIPMQVSESRGKHLAMIWIIDSARARKGESFANKLSAEIVDLSNGLGGAAKKKEDTHRMAEANKALAYLAKIR